MVTNARVDEIYDLSAAEKLDLLFKSVGDARKGNSGIFSICLSFAIGFEAGMVFSLLGDIDAEIRFFEIMLQQEQAKLKCFLPEDLCEAIGKHKARAMLEGGME
jgi:hypothetical protein